jgi:hypothetical protein
MKGIMPTNYNVLNNNLTRDYSIINKNHPEKDLNNININKLNNLSNVKIDLDNQNYHFSIDNFDINKIKNKNVKIF